MPSIVVARPEVGRDLEQGAYHRVSPAPEPLGEEAVDLDPVHRHVHQVGELRPSGPEVVEPDGVPQLAQAGQLLRATGQVARTGRLGELDVHVGRRGSVGGRAGVHGVHPVGVVEVARGEVDADPQVREALPPARQVGGGLVEDGEVERGDQPGLLGETDECPRELDHPGVAVPPGQGLEADQLARGQTHDRLVPRTHLALGDGTTQVGDGHVIEVYAVLLGTNGGLPRSRGHAGTLTGGRRVPCSSRGLPPGKPN